MGVLDARTDKDIARFAADVQAALGDRLVCLALYGSAVGGDFVPGRSDVNVALVVAQVTAAALDALAPLVARARARGFALPLLVDPAYLERARDTFPIELDEIRRQHRLLAGTDAFSGLVIERDALRRACEREARGKQLRLRTLYLDTAGRDDAFEAMLVGSLKSFLLLLRELLVLHGHPAPAAYAATLDAGETLLRPLPVMRRLLAHRAGNPRRTAPELRADFAAYLDEVDRLVAAIDRVDG